MGTHEGVRILNELLETSHRHLKHPSAAVYKVQGVLATAWKDLLKGAGGGWVCKAGRDPKGHRAYCVCSGTHTPETGLQRNPV